MALAVVQVNAAETDQADFNSISAKPVAITLDSSYPLGGYPVTPSVFSMSTKVVGVMTSAGAAAHTRAYAVSTDHVTGGPIRLRVFTVSGNVWTEVAAATSLAGIRIYAMAFGY